MHYSDEELIAGCQAGKRSMQEKLYSKYSSGMFAVALRYSKMRQEAEDILQESFVKVFQSIDKFRSDSSLGYWIKRIVINTALNYQRSKLYLYPMVDINDLKSWTSDSDAIGDYSFNELLDLIHELPDGCRIIFNLYAIEGYKHQEIAKMLEISEGTSKSQYARAKTLLKEKIEARSTVSYEKFEEYGG